MNGPDLRGGLLGAEPPSADLQDLYRERMRTLTERSMSGFERGVHAVGVLIGLGTAARIVQLFVQHRADGRPVAIVGLAVGFAFCAGWVMYSIALLRRRTEKREWHGFLRAQLVGLFTLALAGLMLWTGLTLPDPARGNQLILFGLVFWTTMGLPSYVAYLFQHHELRIRQDLLRLELALAERDEARR